MIGKLALPSALPDSREIKDFDNAGAKKTLFEPKNEISRLSKPDEGPPPEKLSPDVGTNHTGAEFTDQLSGQDDQADSVEAPDDQVLELQCSHCGSSFSPRSSGGKRQKFCSPQCRRYHHDAPAQRAERGTLPNLLPASVSRPNLKKHSSRAKFDRSADAPAGDAEAVLSRKQLSLAVYLNPDGDVVIRDESGWQYTDDNTIVVTRTVLPLLIKRLEELNAD